MKPPAVLGQGQGVPAPLLNQATLRDGRARFLDLAHQDLNVDLDPVKASRNYAATALLLRARTAFSKPRAQVRFLPGASNFGLETVGAAKPP
jgi:hypothetical protein